MAHESGTDSDIGRIKNIEEAPALPFTLYYDIWMYIKRLLGCFFLFAISVSSIMYPVPWNYFRDVTYGVIGVPISIGLVVIILYNFLFEDKLLFGNRKLLYIDESGISFDGYERKISWSEIKNFKSVFEIPPFNEQPDKNSVRVGVFIKDIDIFCSDITSSMKDKIKRDKENYSDVDFVLPKIQGANAKKVVKWLNRYLEQYGSR